MTFRLNGGTLKNGWTEQTNYFEHAGLQLPTESDVEYPGKGFAGWHSFLTFSDEIQLRIPVGQTSDKTFYAQWVDLSYEVVFDANGGQGRVPQKFTVGTSAGLTPFASLAIVSPMGYSFAGWNTEKDGSGVPYEDGQMVMDLAAANSSMTLYAQWTPNPYEVVFDPNGADGGETMANQPFTYDVTQHLDHVAFTYTGYAFESWSSDTNYNNQTAYYADCAEVANLATGGVTTLYANWTGVVYTVTFDANGGTGAMDPLSCTYDMPMNLPVCAFARDGYGFKGWTTNGAEDVLFADGARVTNLTATAGAEVALHACWTGVTYAVTLDARNPRGDGMMTTNGVDGAVSVLTNLYTVGEAWNLPTPTNVNAHLSFGGWKYVDAQGVTNDVPDEVRPPSVGTTNLVCAWTWQADKFAIAVDAPGLEFYSFGTRGGQGHHTEERYDADWEVSIQNGTNAVQSGTLPQSTGDGLTYASWLITKVPGKGVLTFSWRCAAAECFDEEKQDAQGNDIVVHVGETFHFGRFEGDEASGGFVALTPELQGAVDWCQVVYTNNTEGPVTFAWKFQYRSTEDSANGGGTGWVDHVTWTPEDGTEDPPPPAGDESVISFNANGGVLEAESASMTLQNGALSAGAISDLVPAEIQEKYQGFLQQMIDGTFMGE